MLLIVATRSRAITQYLQPSKGIAPLDIPVIPAGPGHYIATGVTVPLAGQWRVTARALLTPIDEATVVGTVDIR